MTRRLVFGVFILLVICLIGLGIQQTVLLSDKPEKEVNVVQDRSKAANFVLPGIDGRKHDLVQTGKPTVIHFWTSWCGSCKVEFPMLQKMYQRYKDDVQFQMVNLTIEDHPEEVKRFIRKENYQFPVLFDFSGEVGEVYQIVSIPTTYFVDQEGVIQKKVMGTMSEEQFRKMVALINPTRNSYD